MLFISNKTIDNDLPLELARIQFQFETPGLEACCYKLC
jgi:hypothetical protein